MLNQGVGVEGVEEEKSIKETSTGMVIEGV